MDEKKFEEGINCFTQLLGSFLELRKMGYTQEEINWAYNTMSGNFVPNFDMKNLSNLIESRKENWKVNKKALQMKCIQIFHNLIISNLVN